MKINKKILIIILVCIVFFGIFIGIRKLNKDGHGIGRVYLTADEMVEMMSYIPHSMVRYEPNVDAYYGNLVKVNDVIPTILSSSFLFRNIDAYKIDDIDDEYTKKKLKDNNIQDNIFLKEDVKDLLLKGYNVNLDSLKGVDDKIKIVDTDKYIVVSPIKIDETTIYTKVFISIDSTYATKSRATIIENALFFKLKDDKYYVYKNSNILDDSNIIETYNKINVDGKTLKGSDIADIIKEDFSNYNYKFKHTFKRNKMGYYWYSTEVIKEK